MGTAIVLFPAAPFLLFNHGKDITIFNGTEVLAFIFGDRKLEMAKFASQRTRGTIPAATATAAEMASLTWPVQEFG